MFYLYEAVENRFEVLVGTVVESVVVFVSVLSNLARDGANCVRVNTLLALQDGVSVAEHVWRGFNTDAFTGNFHFFSQRICKDPWWSDRL